MIWHSEPLAITDAPMGTTVHLQGIYNPPEDRSLDASVIQIQILIIGRDGQSTTTIYDHNPSGLNPYDEPSSEDLGLRYNHKLLKFKSRLSAGGYDDLLHMLRKKGR